MDYVTNSASGDGTLADSAISLNVNTVLALSLVKTFVSAWIITKAVFDDKGTLLLPVVFVLGPFPSASCDFSFKALDFVAGLCANCLYNQRKNRESQNVCQGKRMQDRDEVVLTEGENMLEGWKTCFGQLINIENGRIERLGG